MNNKPLCNDFVLIATDKEDGKQFEYNDKDEYAYPAGHIVSMEYGTIKTDMGHIFIRIKENVYQLKGSGFSFMIKQ